MNAGAFVEFLANGMLNSLWIAALLAAVTWTLLRAAPRTNAATRHLLWWAVLLLILLLPFRGIPLEFLSNRFVAERTVRRSTPVVHYAAPVAEAAFYKPVTAALNAASYPQPAPIPAAAGYWLPLAAVVWASFVFWQLTRIGVGFACVRRIKRRSTPALPEHRDVCQRWMERCGIRRPVALLVSDEITSPLATGFRRPAILLPAQLAPQLEGQELDHVIVHELAHVARRDDWTNLVARTLAALVGLHPVAAWVLRQVERERELACDDWVVSMTGGARPYAASLARLFELCRDRRRMTLAPGMAGSGSQLGERIETLLRRGRDFTRDASWMRVTSIAVVLAVLALVCRAPQMIRLQWPRHLRELRVGPTRRPYPHPVPSLRVQLATVPYQPFRMVLARQAVLVNSRPMPSFLTALAAAGYSNLTVDEIIQLKNSGVSAWYLESLANSKVPHMSIADMAALAHNHVSVDYLSKIQRAGFRKLTTEDVIQLSTHRVRPETFADIHALGFGPYLVPAAIDFTQRGITADFFRSLREAGFKQVDAKAVLDAYDGGVRSSTLREAGQYKSNFTLAQIVKLKQAKVLQ